ncbi:hypothetical protein SASPL_138728 [Salvia splendens]|uniref:Tim10-like domain-containing protein n=1 Tax=Salvia splendens TaxID=180675 RepID=A0A8X8WVQ4_SALSN|nr:hypothetical protein SASPL_138728 [Salvia splendens]
MEFGFGGDFKAVGVADDGGHDNAIVFQMLFFQKESLFGRGVLGGAGGQPPRPHCGYLLEDERTEPNSSEHGSVGANLGNFAPHHRCYVTSLLLSDFTRVSPGWKAPGQMPWAARTTLLSGLSLCLTDAPPRLDPSFHLHTTFALVFDHVFGAQLIHDQQISSHSSMDPSSMNSPELQNLLAAVCKFLDAGGKVATSLKQYLTSVIEYFQQEKQKAMISEMISKLTSACWDKCITGSPGSKFSSSEANCLTNCAQRYMDMSLIIMKRLQQ